MNPAEFFITAFFALFAVVDPIGNLTFYVSLTDKLSRDVRLRIIKKTIIVATSTLLIFTILGNGIFALFGITIPAFKIAGGLLLLRIAFSMMQGEKPRTKQTVSEKEEALQRLLSGKPIDVDSGAAPDAEIESVAVVPLGIPLFAGPGGISTSIILVAAGMSIFNPPAIGMLVVSTAVLSVMALSYILLIYADPLFAKMGKTGTLAFSRIFGLILAAIAIQLISTGFTDIMTQWYDTVVRTSSAIVGVAF